MCKNLREDDWGRNSTAVNTLHVFHYFSNSESTSYCVQFKLSAEASATFSRFMIQLHAQTCYKHMHIQKIFVRYLGLMGLKVASLEIRDWAHALTLFQAKGEAQLKWGWLGRNQSVIFYINTHKIVPCSLWQQKYVFSLFHSVIS